MPIKVYGSVTSRKPDEVYQVAGVTLSDWLTEQTEDYRPGPVQPVTIMIDGELIRPELWSDVTVAADDQVDIRVRPQGGAISDAFESIGGFLVNPFFSLSVSAGNAALNSFIPDIPGQSGAGQQGARLSPAELKANTARLNEVIPEVLGRHIRYPDYLNAPRKYYKSPRVQAQDVLLSVGVGSYLVETANLKIGETPFSQLSNNISFQFFEPGASVTAHPAYQNWYTAPEVGSTTGSSGIRLYRARSLSAGIQNVQLQYSGTDITTTSASVFFPTDWAEGDFIAISERQSLTVTVDGSDVVTLSGDWAGIEEGDPIRLRSTDLAEANGVFVVETKSGGDITLLQEGVQVTGWAAGSYLVFLRRDDVDYQIDSIIYDTAYPTQVDGYSLSRFVAGAEDTGWAGFAGGTGFADVLLSARAESEGWAGPFSACPDGETTSLIEVDFFLPQGQGFIDEDTVVPFEAKRQVEIQWREIGETTWNSQVYTIDNATRDQLGFSYKISLGSSIRPEVRVRRVTEESTELTDLDRIEWTLLKARLPTVTSYPGITVLAVTIEGTDEIGSQSNNRINLIPVRKLPTWDGSGWTAPQATRDISAALVYTAKTVGYTDDDIDLDELDRLHTIWDNRGDRFDHQFGATTVKTAMDVILRAGMAELTIMGGLLTPARDEPRTQFEQPYSPANMTGPLQRSFQTVRHDDFDGVEVEYVNSDTWTTETVLCLLSGDQGIKLDKMKLDGVTDRTRAWRIGMRRRRAQKYRRWTYSFQTELDALNSGYLSYVPLIDDIPGYGKAAIMRDIQEHPDGALVTVTEPMEWVDGETHVIAYRDEEGDLVGPFTATQGDTDYQIIADIPLPWPDVNARQEPPHVFFGTTEKWTFPALVQDVTPNGSERCSVQAVNYDGRVYDDDDNSPP